MKRLIFLLILLIMLFSACSCAAPQQAPVPDAVETKPVTEASPASTPAPTPDPTPEPSPGPTSVPISEVQEWPTDSNGYPIEIKSDETIGMKSVSNTSQTLTPPKYKTYDLLFKNWRCFTITLDSHWNSDYTNTRPDYSDYLLAHFPDAVWRKMDTGFTYAMLDGDDNTRAYIYYTQSSNCNEPAGYPIIMSKKLSFEDFSGIGLSDTSDSVALVDPVTKYHIEMLNMTNDFSINLMIDKDMPPCSVHLLTDGILKYTYERSGEEGNYVYTIVDIEYHENFKMEGLGGVTDYSIAEIDYVD